MKISIISLFISALFLTACASKPKTIFDRSKINKIFQDQKHDQEINNCYKRLRFTNPKAQGELEINYYFRSRFIKEVTIKKISPSLKNTDFEMCVLAIANTVNLNNAIDSAETADTEVHLELNRIYMFK